MDNSQNSPAQKSIASAATSSATLLLPDESPTFSWLVTLSGKQRGQLHRIKRIGVTIGRERDNDIVLADETVSRHHARLLVEPGIGNPQIYIQDLASANGVSVNGVRVVRQLLEDEDRIIIGETTFAFKQL